MNIETCDPEPNDTSTQSLEQVESGSETSVKSHAIKEEDETEASELTPNTSLETIPTIKPSSFSFPAFKSKIEKSNKQIAISRKMKKFFNRRYQLFNRFDAGVLMDLESWYSVTPEVVAKHIAERCFAQLGSSPNRTVLDAFCGSGGNTIQFAKQFDTVLSCDIDFIKLQCAQFNANNVYEVGHKINFIMQDFFNLHNTLSEDIKIDMVFLSPPWGGVNYFHAKEADISEFPIDCFKIYTHCVRFLKCENLVFFLPRNVNLEQVLCMAGPGGFVEFEQNFLDHKLVAISSYHGDLCDKKSFLVYNGY